MRDILRVVRGAIADKVFDRNAIKKGVELRGSQANAEVTTSFGETPGEVSRANAELIRRFENDLPAVAASIRSQLEESDGDLSAVDYVKALRLHGKSPNDATLSIAKTYAKSLAVNKFLSE